MRPTGLKKRPEETRRHFAATRSYPVAMLPLATVLQPIAFVKNQREKPSCVGQAWTSAIEAHTGWRASPVDLWTDARRRQGSLGDPFEGTESSFAIESLMNRGLSPYVPGEDERPVDEDMKLPALSQELAADDNRTPAATDHKVIDAPRRAPAVDALQRGKAVCTGGGIRDVAAYSSLQTNQVADETMLGGDKNGHEQRVAGYIAEDDARFPEAWRGCFILQNSWGDFAGVVLPCDVTRTDGSIARAGTLLEGCALVKASVLDTQWDCDVMEVVVS